MKKKYANTQPKWQSVKIECQKRKKKKGILYAKHVTRLDLLSGSTYYTIYSKLNPLIDYQNKFHFINSEL